jgi:hypothetical protein
LFESKKATPKMAATPNNPIRRSIVTSYFYGQKYAKMLKRQSVA